MSTKVIFFGNERLVSGLKHTDCPTLNGLIRRGYDIQAIVSHHGETKSRTNRPLEVAEIGQKYHIPVLTPNKPGEIIDQLKEYKAEIAVLVAYGRIIPQKVIDIFPKGIVNIHPSLLPKHRGPTPIESAIENGDAKTGVSLMKLTAGMDNGPLFAQTSLNLTGNETKFDVYTQLSQLGAKLLFTHLPHILDGSLTPTPQDDSQATYSHLFEKSDAHLDVTHLTATEAERCIRAHLEFPKTKFTVNNMTLIITKAHVNYRKETVLDIQCSDNNFLSIDELIAPNGKRMSKEAFLRGYAA